MFTPSTSPFVAHPGPGPAERRIPTCLLVVLVMLATTLLAVGCGRTTLPRLVLDTHPILMFGFMPYSDESHMRGLFRALEGYLAPEVKMEMRFILTRDYPTMGRLMENNMVDIAWFTPASYALIGRAVGARPLCKPFRRGSATYRPLVVVRADSKIRSLPELAGKRFAYVERNSTSGFIVPNQMLARIGVSDPLSFFSETHFTHNHIASLRGVKDGRFDAAAVYEGATEEVAAQLGATTFRTIGTGPAVPNDPIVSRRGLDPALVEKIQRLLLTMHENRKGREALAQLDRLERITNFMPTKDADYSW